MHARMEEEYRLALGSADQERARLEETITSLEGQLAEERSAQATRYFVRTRTQSMPAVSVGRIK